MKEALRQRARELGFDDCRVTTASPPETAPYFQQWLAAGRQGRMAWLERSMRKRTDPQVVLPGARSIITLAASYHCRGSQTGSVARYARFDDYHNILSERLKILTDFVSQLGESGTRSQWYVDVGPVLERDVAQRAGLGFIGKHTNLISRRLGNWFFLAEIITTLALEPDPSERTRCGSCRRCIKACPTAAIIAPFQLDARYCISYLTIELKGSIPVALRPAIGNRIFGCDECLLACPWNRFAREGQIMKTYARPGFTQLDLLELLTLGESEFTRRFAGTPIQRVRRRGLVRNVCVALGNTGGEPALAALHKATSDAEPLVAQHAQWAVEQVTARISTHRGVLPD
ncbi:MAG: tRNA epoxyqueuosine(34) reductase QueG [Verrucomicrobiota bacterium]|nr:tRNA epoxyqueuosine(34) reductase QueG [Verrucomicrobiota bacterium]